MSAAAPNPNNLILLGLLGIGAWWFMSRQAQAGTVAAGLTLQQQRDAAAKAAQKQSTLMLGTNLIGSLLSSVKNGLVGTVPSAAAVKSASLAAQRDEDPTLNGSVSDWVGGGADGAAINPVFDSAYDFTKEFWY